MSSSKKRTLLVTGLFIVLIGLIVGFIFWQVPDQKTVNVYFAKVSGADVVTEAVSRPYEKPLNAVEAAMSSLVKGPTVEEEENGYYSEIPKGTEVLALTETPEELTINLSEEFTNGGGSTSMVTRLEQVRKTATDAAAEKDVFLQVEGKPLEILGGEGVEVTQPLEEAPTE